MYFRLQSHEICEKLYIIYKTGKTGTVKNEVGFPYSVCPIPPRVRKKTQKTKQCTFFNFEVTSLKKSKKYGETLQIGFKKTLKGWKI